MSPELVDYIRRNDYIYNFLRDDSSYYAYLYNDNRNIKMIKRLAKEKYGLRYVDKMDRLSSKMEVISSIIDVLK